MTQACLLRFCNLLIGLSLQVLILTTSVRVRDGEFPFCRASVERLTYSNSGCEQLLECEVEALTMLLATGLVQSDALCILIAVLASETFNIDG
jgi:hypothetical protein